MLKNQLNTDEYYYQNPTFEQQNHKIKKKNNSYKKDLALEKSSNLNQDTPQNQIFKNIKKTTNNLKNTKVKKIQNQNNNNQQKKQLKDSIQLLFSYNILQNFKLQRQNYQKTIQTNSNSKGKVNFKKLLKNQSCNLKNLKKSSYPKYDERGQYFCDSVRFQKDIYLQKNSKSNSKSSRSKKSRGSITSPLRSIRKLNKSDQIRSPISKVYEVLKKQQKQKSRRTLYTKKNSPGELSQSKSLDRFDQLFHKKQILSPFKLKTIKYISAQQLQHNQNNNSVKRLINDDYQNQQIDKPRFYNQNQSKKNLLHKYLSKKQQQQKKRTQIKQIFNDIQPINHIQKKNKKQVQSEYRFQQFQLVHNLLINPDFPSMPSKIEDKKQKLQFTHQLPTLKKSGQSQFDYSEYGIDNQQSQIITEEQVKNTIKDPQFLQIIIGKNQSSKNEQQYYNLKKPKRSKILIGKVISPKKILSISGSNKSLRISSRKKKEEISKSTKLFNSLKFSPQNIQAQKQQISIINFESSQSLVGNDNCSSIYQNKTNSNRQSQKTINMKKKDSQYSYGQYTYSLHDLQAKKLNKINNIRIERYSQKLTQKSVSFSKKLSFQDKKQTYKQKQKSQIHRIISLKNMQKDAIKKININKNKQTSKQKYGKYQSKKQSSLQYKVPKLSQQYNSYRQNIVNNNNKSKLTSALRSSSKISQYCGSLYESSQYMDKISNSSGKKYEQKNKSRLKIFSNNTIEKNQSLKTSQQISLSSHYESDSKRSLLISNSNQLSSKNYSKQQRLEQKIISFKKKKTYVQHTLNDIVKLIQQHQQRIQSLCLYIDNCKNFYEEEYDIQKYQFLCFLMLKKNIYELQRVISALKLQKKSVFNLSQIQIADQVLQKYVDKQEIIHQQKNLAKQSQQRKKQFKDNYLFLQNKYQNQKGFNLSFQDDDFSSQIVNKLIQQLNILYEKWEKNKSDGDKHTTLKIAKKLQKKMVEIIELIFLISQLDGKKIKAFQLFTQKQQDFRSYYEKYFQKIIQTIEYFDSKKRNSN